MSDHDDDHDDDHDADTAMIERSLTHFYLADFTFRVRPAGGMFLAAGDWGRELRRRNARMRLAYMAPEHVSS